MSYPDDKETFPRRSTNDIIPADDHNDPVDFLERLQDVLGLNIEGASADLDARIDVIESFISALKIYEDRGDPADFDYDIGDFTRDESWYDLDLSSIVPAGVKVVSLMCRVNSAGAGRWIMFRKNGNVNNISQSRVVAQVANVSNFQDLIVACDTNRVIEYRVTAAGFTDLDLVVKGWWY